MNKERRKNIEKVSERIEALRTIISDIMGDIDSLQSEERDYFDNMPESLQNGDKGSASEDAADQLQEAYDALDQVDGQLDEAVSALAEAAQ